jgi:D-xylose transport system substrate-binding protein
MPPRPYLCLLFLACATTLFASKEKPVIGLSLDTLKEERWQRDRDTFIAEAEKRGAKVIVQSANSDDVRQVRDVESLLSRGVDVLVIVPHNGEAMTRAVKSANEAKVPVISYDRLILNASVDYYLSFDNIKVGETQAGFVAARLPAGRKARIVRIYGAPTDNNAKMFKQGQDNVLRPLIAAGKIEVVHEDWALEWKPENAKKIMNAALTKSGTQIDAVVASNDGTAGGAIQALLEEGLAGKVLVTGQDADLAACQRIRRGTQAMTVYKPVRNLAVLAARVAVEVAQGGKPATTTSLNNGVRAVPSIFEQVVAVDRETSMPRWWRTDFTKRRTSSDGRAERGTRMTTVLAARSLTKRFPGVVALRDVTFELRAGRGSRALRRERRGEIHPDQTPGGHSCSWQLRRQSGGRWGTRGVWRHSGCGIGGDCGDHSRVRAHR